MMKKLNNIYLKNIILNWFKNIIKNIATKFIIKF